MNEGFIKTPIEPRKPDTKFGEAETEAEACCKKYHEAEAEAIKGSILGSRSRGRSQQLLNVWKPKPAWKPAFSRRVRLPEAEGEAEAGFQPNPDPHCL